MPRRTEYRRKKEQRKGGWKRKTHHRKREKMSGAPSIQRPAFVISEENQKKKGH